jgi:hypothetical protein
MTDIFDEVWCRGCGLVDDAIVIDEDFGSLCEDNFWGDYELTIACVNCLEKETIHGTHDGVETQIDRDDFEILLPSDSDEAKKFLMEVAEFEMKVSNSALDLVVMNSIIRKLCLRKDNLLSEIIRVSFNPMQTDYQVPYLVFTTYECDRVKKLL